MPRPVNPTLKTDLLDAAIQLLESKGPAFSIRDLSSSIGYSTTAIYRCFSSRGDLLKAIQLRLFEELTTSLMPASMGGVEVSQAILDLGRGFVAWGVANPVRYEFMFHNAEPDALLEGPERALAQAPLVLLESLLTQGMSTGELQPSDAKAAALMLFSGVHGLVSLYAAHRLDGFVDTDPVEMYASWSATWMSQMRAELA